MRLPTSADDDISGGDGLDTLTGGAGFDAFVFDVKPRKPTLSLGVGHDSEEAMEPADAQPTPIGVGWALAGQRRPHHRFHRG